MKHRTGISVSHLTSGFMICIALLVVILARGACCQTSDSSVPTHEKNWSRFRGPGGLGISQDPNIPLSWNGTTGAGILWKTVIPLPGLNSPVVWEDRVFLTGANKQHRAVYCFDANSGKRLWQRAVENIPQSQAPSEDISEDTGYAASTAATDGQHVFAIFANGDLACFDFKGKQRWARSVGPLENMYGPASSLLVHENRLLIQLDQARTEDKLSKLLAIEGRSGKTLWEIPRPVPNSWATPIIINTGQREELVTCANPWVIAYEPVTGKALWQVKCLGGDVAASPVYAQGLMYAVKPYESLTAIRPGGLGDVTETHTAWTIEGVMPDICSPVTNGELLWVLETEGILTCYDALNGERIWEEDLANTFMASPSLVSDKVYLTAEDGSTVIIKAARQYVELGEAELGETVKASLAFHSARIYMRGTEHLYCVAR